MQFLETIAHQPCTSLLSPYFTFWPPQSATGSFVQKGDTPTGTLTTSYSPIKDVTVDLQVNQCGKITTTLAHSGLYPGLKTTLSGQPVDPPSLKLAAQLYQAATGVKVGNVGCLTIRHFSNCGMRGKQQNEKEIVWFEGLRICGVRLCAHFSLPSFTRFATLL